MQTLVRHGLQVQKMYEAFRGGDISSILTVLSKDVIWEVMGQPHVLYAGIYHGPDDVKHFFKSYRSFVEIKELQVEHILENGHIVMASGRMHVRGRNTGRSFSAAWSMIWEFNDDGEVVHFRDYCDTLAFARGLAL